MLSPIQKRNWKQVIVFACIWSVSALLYTNIEAGILGDFDYYPSTGNAYDFWSSLLLTTPFSFVIGLLQGWIEVAFLAKRFQNNSLWVKILAKTLFYLGFILFFLVFLTGVSNSIILERPLFDPLVLQSLVNFIGAFSFWSVIIYISAIILFAITFFEMVNYFGMSLLFDLLRGRFHHPNTEVRIFMFLDMKSSTSIAEKIGHTQYFHLIKNYYADMTEPILETEGEIYQYVGDEIVVSWLEKKGLFHNNCVHCFRKISESIEANRQKYLDQFGFVPQFKAGFHMGEVTSGAIGILKKEIIYTGDILNTTARIQAECNKYETQLLLSDELYEKLAKEDGFKGVLIGALQLRGKSEPTNLYSLSFCS
ncbi:MAG: adenylate/guanylate cyclase domain-containing protein [Bacteroidota bacterium]